MPASVRIRGVDRTAMFKPGGALDPVQAARAVADFHRARVAEAEALDSATTGQPIAQATFVNGAPSSDFDKVLPGQSIVTTFDLGSEALQWIFEALKAAAPVKSGAYRSSISIYADGALVASIQDTLGAAEIVFVPLVPYARKIERGQSPKAPNGVFEAVAAIAAARYGNQARVAFTFREPVGGADALQKWARKHSAKAAKPRRQYSVDVRQPAVVVTFR